MMPAVAANVTDTGMILSEFVVRGGNLFSLYFVQMLNPHAVLRIHIYYYADLDPGSKKSPYGSGSGS